MKALIFDLETTGLLNPDWAASQPRIIEIGAALIDATTYKESMSISQLVNPGIPIEPIITKITGITQADLDPAPKLIEVIGGLRRAFSKAQILVTHNLPFDKGVLQAELRRLMLDVWPWPAQEMCTVQAYAHEYGRNPKLIELYERKLGRPLAQTHRALDDVRALIEILRADNTLEMYA